MTDNGAGLASPQYFERKIDTVERELRGEISAIRTEMRGMETNILERIDRTAAKPTNPYQLIGTAISIVVVLGAAGTYIATGLNNAIAANEAALERQNEADIQDRRRLYDYIATETGKSWTKDAHTEFERRVDDRNRMEQDNVEAQFARLEKSLDTTVANMVPRAEHEQQWKNQQDALTRLEAVMAKSMDRLAEHVNQSDATSAAKIADLERAVHGYGLTDEVKSIQDKLQNLSDKIFELAAPKGAIAK